MLGIKRNGWTEEQKTFLKLFSKKRRNGWVEERKDSLNYLERQEAEIKMPFQEQDKWTWPIPPPINTFHMNLAQKCN